MNDELEAKALGPDALAARLALDSSSSGDARDFLREQTRLARLQAKDLEEEGRLRHWSLRVRHISDLMKVAFEIAVAFIVVSIAVGLGAAIWTASRDNGLVIEAFSVPPDLAQRGITGQVVASQMLDKLTRMQNATDSGRPAQSYANNWTSDIKVQIPDTGVSIGEMYRFLKQWLGHDTHITGEVYRAAGGIAVTARVAGEDGATFSGGEGDLDSLEQKAAEDVYERTQPYRFSVYLRTERGDIQRSRAILRKLISSDSAMERAWAYIGLGGTEERLQNGNAYAEAADYRQALANVPDLTLGASNLSSQEQSLGHDEASLAVARLTARLLDRSPVPDMSAKTATALKPLINGVIALTVGDTNAAWMQFAHAAARPDYAYTVENAHLAIANAIAMAHDVKGAHGFWDSIAASLIPAGTPNGLIPYARATIALGRLQMDLGLRDWHALEQSASTLEKFDNVVGGTANVTTERFAQPALALARSELGDPKAGEALIATAPSDCYFCVRVRARIAALAGHRSEADRWFDIATKQAPSIPMAFAEWGAVLLGEGRYDEAIAKVTTANKVGPHFADPLELWGEALMQKNRSDLALAKFEEANEYAPHWGRLHLEWGRALLYVGRKDEAEKQFAIARELGENR